MNTYEDMLVTDTVRIQRAKKVLKDRFSDRRQNIEAINLLKLYKELAEEFKENGTDEERERAEEILYELSKV